MRVAGWKIMVITCMKYSDQMLLPVLKVIGTRQTTAHEISALSGVPYSTVKRRLSVMKRSGVIRVSGSGRRWGFSVEVINAE